MSSGDGLDLLKPFLPGLEAALDDPDVSEIMNQWAGQRLAGRTRPTPADSRARARRGGAGAGGDPYRPAVGPGPGHGRRSSMRASTTARAWRSASRRPARTWRSPYGGSAPRSFSAAQLVAQGALPDNVRHAAERTLHTRRNILVSGGTGSGKTTLLNALIELLPDDERIVAIEDTLELRIDRPNCVRFEARGLHKGAVTIRDLVRHALRHRPDHIVVGEVRGGEAARPVASPQHRPRRLAHHRPCEQRRERPVPLGELRDAGWGRSPVDDVTCRGVVDGVAMVIHMTRRDGRRFVEEAAVVNGYDAGTNTWDIHRLDRVTV